MDTVGGANGIFYFYSHTDKRAFGDKYIDLDPDE